MLTVFLFYFLTIIAGPTATKDSSYGDLDDFLVGEVPLGLPFPSSYKYIYPENFL